MVCLGAFGIKRNIEVSNYSLDAHENVALSCQFLIDSVEQKVDDF